MKPQLPEFAALMRAVETYLGVAYGSKPPPAAVRTLVEKLQAHQGATSAAPGLVQAGERYSLRLGNPSYPHMKLLIEPAPDGRNYLFKADTHDRHITVPPGSSEHAAFSALMRQNQQLAERIDAALAEAGLPTFKTFLQEDLARRKAQASTHS